MFSSIETYGGNQEVASTSSAAVVPDEEELQEDLGTMTSYYRESLQLVLRGF